MLKLKKWETYKIKKEILKAEKIYIYKIDNWVNKGEDIKKEH
ncbi:hypothetical protein FVAG_03101 [Fusobacterium varium ATCC 27725]|nr:hypothetical protein FVAG_03101 [Fusobacterium varium ATCC 27725]VEH38912.1 Uncharacterised protein [Fusobacterium varium]